MRTISVIGVGTGNPDHLTQQAIHALQRLDVVFVLDKGETKADLVALRTQLCQRHRGDKAYRLVELPDPVRDPAIADYRERVAHWHAQRVALYEAAFRDQLAEHEHGAVLAWGDPGLYDSTLRLLDQLQRRGQVPFTYHVIPGITSIAALTASHRIPLNHIGGSVLITTGRRLREEGWPANAEDVVVMLDGEHTFAALPPEGLEIFWGAYLGTPDEILRAGPLAELRDELIRVRTEARAKHGWIMDIYLLRRRSRS